MSLAAAPMGLPSVLVVGALAALLSGLLTGLVRRLVIARSVLDIPNERSLHQVPTPRGGGLAIVAVVLMVILWLGARSALPGGVTIGLAGGIVLVAGIGWVDDVRNLSSAVRAAVQGAAGLWFLYWIGGVESLRLGESVVVVGPVLNLVALLAIVWSINLYNFMDGIDGLAGGQAVVASGLAVGLLTSGDPALALLAVAIGGAAIGFLGWNWSPARIFLGDAGSGVLGFLFAALALLSERTTGPSAIAWLFFGGVFVFDATLTLIRRMLRGERWYAAHRSHAYQRAVQSGWSHARVTLGALTLTAAVGLLGVVAVLRPALLWAAGAAALVLLLSVYLWIESRWPMTRGPGAAAEGSEPPVRR